jgi:hypothetical protein
MARCFASVPLTHSAAILALLVALGLGPAAPAVTAQTTPADSCHRLAGQSLPDTTIKLADLVPAGTFTPPDGTPAIGDLPAFCRVWAVVAPQITIEVWLPAAGWNGKFQGVGGGGYAGIISYPALADALRAGYATASTDTGHAAADPMTAPLNGTFGLGPDGQLNWRLIEDFASRSLHEMTVKGKALTQAFYGSAPKYAYWTGCSTGGRQGLMLAQRYPTDYNAILAGAPANNWSRFIPAEFWPQLVMLQAGDFVPQCKFDAVTAAAVAECDGLDGVEDGVIDDPRGCSFDPMSMVGTETPCGTITATDAEVIRSIWQGARDTSGRFLWFGLEPGAPFNGLANTVTAPDGSTSGAPFPIATDWIRLFLLQTPEWDWRTATPEQFDQWFQHSVEQYTHVLGTDDPDLSDFRDAGGKLLLWHGWADQLIFPRQAIDYYERVERAMGGPQRTGEFARLFMAPGVAHCRGGPGPNEFDGLGPLVEWVEHGVAPDALVAAHRTNGVVDRTRPLCMYPMVARWTGQGSTDEAANFSCTAEVARVPAGPATAPAPPDPGQPPSRLS